MKCWIKFFALLMLSTACSPVAFDSVPSELNSSSSNLFSNFFKLDVSQLEFQQPTLESNDTQIVFQALQSNGSHVSDLKVTDIEIFENGRVVPEIRLNSNSKKIEQTVDIVFAVDITGSMESTIESAKMRLINFISKSRASGRHTRMCLVTFGDFTLKKCDRFYDNNPNDPKTEVQVRELVSEISKLKALTGGDDPGGYDLNENPMRALIDAGASPWGEMSQRFVILVTDDGFLYSPGNQGAVGNLAPRYAEVIGAIKKSQMKVFAATPSRPGYNLPFQGNPGIVQASLGEWFNFDGLIKGSITLDTILNRIIDRVQTNYIATYKVDESMGFDPTIPLAARKIELKIKPGRNTIIDLQSIQSNLPNGREGYKKRFKIGTAKRIHRESLTVHINGQRQSAYEVLADGDLEFSNAPAPNSKIQITFSYLDLKDSVSLQPIILQDPNVRSLADLSVLLNGQLANPQDYDVAQTIEGFLSIRLNDSTLRSEDPYKVRENGGLDVKVYSGRIRVMKSN